MGTAAATGRGGYRHPPGVLQAALAVDLAVFALCSVRRLRLSGLCRPRLSQEYCVRKLFTHTEPWLSQVCSVRVSVCPRA